MKHAYVYVHVYVKRERECACVHMYVYLHMCVCVCVRAGVSLHSSVTRSPRPLQRNIKQIRSVAEQTHILCYDPCRETKTAPPN